MPWTAELPDGSIREFTDDTTERDVQLWLYKSGQLPDAPSGFFAALSSSVEGIKGRLSAAPHLVAAKISGDREQFAKGVDILKASREEQHKRLPFPVSFEDVLEEEGVFNTLRKFAEYAPEVTAQSIPYLVPQTAATGATRIAGRMIPSIGKHLSPVAHPFVRAAIPAAVGSASMLPVYFSDNLARQVDAGAAGPWPSKFSS